MDSAKTCVTKFKSFAILLFTPILMLPLVILIPDKVSCVSGQPGGIRVPSAITGTEPGNAELERVDSSVGTSSPGTRAQTLQAPDRRCSAKNSRDAQTLR